MATENENVIISPLVFQCLKCKTIVGDSFSFNSSNNERQTISLYTATNIKRIPEFHTSKNGYDIGSTYIIFVCQNCENPLGRFYLTTSKDLDHIREIFTFNINTISSYELGRTQHGKVPDQINSESGEAIVSLPEQMNSAIVETIKELNEEIQKIQVVLVGLVDRVTNLETSQKRELELQNSSTDEIERRPLKSNRRE